MLLRKRLAISLLIIAVVLLLPVFSFSQVNGQEILRDLINDEKALARFPFGGVPVGQVVLLFPDLAEMNLGDFFAFLEDIAGVPKGTLIKTDFGELKVGLMAVNDIKNIPQNLLLPDVLKIIGAEAERTDDFLKKIQEVVKILNVRWKPRVVSTHGKKSTTWGSVKAR